MLLAELNVRHTRRHMPTRRVALDDGYLPTSGSAFGGVLLGAVIAEHVPGLDEEQLDALHRLVDDARDGLTVPRIALRYRLQTDTHGLDLSRHRITERRRRGREPPPHPRARPPWAARAAGDRRTDGRRRAPAVGAPHGVPVRRRRHRPSGVPPRRARGPADVRGPPRVAAVPARVNVHRERRPRSSGDEWRGVPSERRWAMEVLGLRSGMLVERDDVQKRFRRLVRLAHPDHGAGQRGRRRAHRRARRRARAAARPRRLGGRATSGIASAHAASRARHRQRRERKRQLRAPQPHRERPAARSRPTRRACACSTSSPRWARSRAS